MRSVLSGTNRRLERILSSIFLRAIIYLADGFIVASSSLIAPIFAIFVERIGGGIPEAGIAMTIYSLTAGFGIIYFSRTEDRLKDFKDFVVVGYLFAVCGYLIYFFATSIWILYLAQFVLGIATAIRVPAYDALLTQSAPGHVAIAWGNWYAMVFFVTAINAFGGAIIADTYGFRVLILIILIFSLMAFIVSLLLINGDGRIRLVPQSKEDPIMEEK